MTKSSYRFLVFTAEMAVTYGCLMAQHTAPGMDIACASQTPGPVNKTTRCHDRGHNIHIIVVIKRGREARKKSERKTDERKCQ
jgi:hypothetical protein